MVWATMMRFDRFFCNEFEADLHEELKNLSGPKKSSASDFADKNCRILHFPKSSVDPSRALQVHS
jgi:hypothetical protein